MSRIAVILRASLILAQLRTTLSRPSSSRLDPPRRGEVNRKSLAKMPFQPHTRRRGPRRAKSVQKYGMNHDILYLLIPKD